MRHLPVTLAAVAALFGTATPVALAAEPAPTAHVKITLASPAKGTSTPRFAGVTLSAGRPAVGTRSSISLPTGAARIGTTSTAPLRGTLTLRNGRRRATVSALRLSATTRGLRVTGRINGATITVFESRTGTAGTASARELRLRRGALKLTRPGASRLSRTLRRTLRPGTTLGVISGTLQAADDGAPATGTGAPATGVPTAPALTPAPAPAPPPAAPPVDPGPVVPPFGGPFGDACLAETAFDPLVEEVPGPAPLPAAVPATAATLTWDMRPSFRDYVDAGGRIATWNGAGRTADGRFTFTLVDAERSGDQVIARFRGRIDFCYPAHSFRIALADPTVVIDGGGPRVLMTGDSYQGVPPVPATLVPPRRVRFTTFTAPVPVAAGATRTWTVVGTTLTTAGADIANATESPGAGFWGENTPFGGFVLTTTD